MEQGRHDVGSGRKSRGPKSRVSSPRLVTEKILMHVSGVQSVLDHVP